jgi:outer membrane protein OmpA-like peptidoglycan-associated protein
MLSAHETIRLAVEAEKLARRVAFENALDEERLANAQRIGELTAAVESATNEADRARLAAEQRALDREIAARARDSAEREAQEAEERAEEERSARLQAERERLEAERRKVRAEEEKLRAEEQAGEARQALETALRQVAEVQDTARGLIVAVPNVLFESGSASLTAAGREKLAKIAGVLLVSNDCGLIVEGHTDDVGDDSYNQELSEERAREVREYLLSQRILPERVISRGFGESRPIASNDTKEGRQQNRRVEIVIEDDVALRIQRGESH